MIRKSFLWSIPLLAIGIGLCLWLFEREDSVRNFPNTLTGPILFFGDSLVEGVGATPGHDLPSLLSRSLGEPVLNYGQAGDTTSRALTRLPVALEERPKLVLLLLGGNDFIQKVPRQTVFSNLESIVTAFQDQGAMVLIIGVRSGILGGGADDDFEALAKKTRSAYLEDTLRGVFGDTTLMNDAIHPNDRGYAKINERLIPQVKALLQKESLSQ